MTGRRNGEGALSPARQAVAVRNFIFEANPSRIVFGTGSLDRLADEAERLGLSRVAIICSPGRRGAADQAASVLGAASAGICEAGATGVPAAAFEAAMDMLQAVKADGFVALGGGSTNGLGKAVGHETGLPFIAVATTYGGSELRNDWRVEAGDTVRRGVSARARAATVIYDPLLTLDLPASVSGTTGVNAICHAVESMYSAEADPIAMMTGEAGIRALAASLPRIARDIGDLDARIEALHGAWLAGGFRAGSGLEHRIAQTIRSRFDLEHAATHAVVLPHVVAFNRDAAPEAMARIARALGADDAAAGLFDLNVALGIRTSLKALGLTEPDLDTAADIVGRAEFANPRPAGRDDIRALLDDAFSGRRPDTCC